MGYHIVSLDMCFGIQLVDSRGDIGVYAQGLMHVLVFCFSGRNLGALFEFICVGLSIMNLKLFCVILVRTLGQIDRKEQLRGGFVPYKRFLLMFSARQELWSDSSLHFEGWLYDPIILALLRDQSLLRTSEEEFLLTGRQYLGHRRKNTRSTEYNTRLSGDCSTIYYMNADKTQRRIGWHDY